MIRERPPKLKNCGPVDFLLCPYSFDIFSSCLSASRIFNDFSQSHSPGPEMPVQARSLYERLGRKCRAELGLVIYYS
jgi:hypothetical protein